MAVAPDHPLAKARRREQPGRSPPSSRSASSIGTSAGGDRDGREEGLRHRHPRRASVRPGLDAAGLRRQLRADGLRHRRDLRLPGARPARPRLRHASTACRSCRWCCRRAPTRHASRSTDDGLSTATARMINSRFLDGLTHRRRPRTRSRAARSASRAAADRRSARSITACATGASRASATGAARSRSSIARPAASCRCRDDHLPVDAARGRRPSTSPATRSTAIRPGSTSTCPQCGGPARRETDTWTPSSIRPGTSPASPRQHADDADRHGGGRATGCRSTSISAASSTRSCTCSTRASSPARMKRDRPCSASTSRSRACSPRAWSCTRPIAAADGDWLLPAEVRIEARATARSAPSIADRRAGRDRPDREDVEVEEERRRPRRHHRALRRRHRALVHAVRQPARARRDWTEAGVEGAGRFVQRVWRLVGEIAERHARAGARRERRRRGRWRRAQGRAQGAGRRRARISSACASTAAWRRSTSSPTPCRPALGRRAAQRRRASPRRSARRPRSWCS